MISNDIDYRGERTSVPFWSCRTAVTNYSLFSLRMCVTLVPPIGKRCVFYMIKAIVCCVIICGWLRWFMFTFKTQLKEICD